MQELYNTIEELTKWLMNDNERGIWKYEVNGKQVEKIEFKNGKKFVGVCNGIIDYPKEKTEEEYITLALYISFLTAHSNDDINDDEE